MRLCEVMFFAGVLGSMVVVVISSIEDVRELMSSE